MSRINFRERINKKLFLLDGAMGTQLITHGVNVGKCNDYLNIDSADIIFDIHQAYLQAGSDAVLTNTFGANKYTLSRHGFGNKVKEINTAGAQIARRAADDEKYVLGDIGPSGDFLQPLGNLKPEELKDAFAEQAKALLAGEVDGFIIETMTALEEATIAIEAVKSVSDLPILVSLAYDSVADKFRTMMGLDPATAAGQIIQLGVDAIGFNCGSLNMDQYVELAQSYTSEIKGGTILLAEPNAGKPELIEGQTVYKISPEDFADTAEKIYSAGVNILGGCCGTSPAHIEAIAKKLKN